MMNVLNCGNFVEILRCETRKRDNRAFESEDVETGAFNTDIYEGIDREMMFHMVCINILRFFAKISNNFNISCMKQKIPQNEYYSSNILKNILWDVHI